MRYLLCVLTVPLLLAACSSGSDDSTADNPTATPQAAAPTATIAGNAAESVASSAATTVIEISPPTATDSPVPASEPVPTSAADLYALQGYHHFERPEIALMIHPRLSEEATDPPTGEATLYSFVDLNSPYLRLDVDILKGVGSMSEVSDGFIRDHFAALVESAPHISTYEIFDSQQTELTGRPGRIARLNFTSDGMPAYGAILLFSYNDWLYRIIVYGDSYEYPTLEDMIHSIFTTAFLRGPA